MINQVQFTQFYFKKELKFYKSEFREVEAHANEDTGTLFYFNKYKFNYTKINRSSFILRSIPDLRITYAFIDFSIIEIFLMISNKEFNLIRVFKQ